MLSMKIIKIKNNNKKTNTTVGFTLIEALVAIAVLMVAITGPMVLAQKSLSSADLSKDQTTASFLAQDAIEDVLNIRDTIAVSQTTGSWLTGPTLQEFLAPCICTGVACNFDSKIVTPVSCSIDTTYLSHWTDPLAIQSLNSNSSKLDMTYSIDANGVKHFLTYDYNPNNLSSCSSNSTPGSKCSTVSKFSRYINIQIDPTNTNQNEAVINVRVSWNSPLGVQKIPLQRFIYNYSENLQ
jgi:Tfp pilus assembly protein PilV